MRRAVVVPLLAAMLLAGCGGPHGSATSSATALGTTAPGTTAPAIPAAELAGVSVQIRQPRADWADRVVQLRVRNSGDVELTVGTGELVTGYDEGSATSDPEDARTVPAG